MVKRYESDMYGRALEEAEDGYWVQYDDYAAMQAALKEALALAQMRYFSYPDKERERIAELRKQFLE